MLPAAHAGRWAGPAASRGRTRRIRAGRTAAARPSASLSAASGSSAPASRAAADVVVGELFQAAQDVRGARRCGEGRQGAGPGRARRDRPSPGTAEAPDLGQQRRQGGAARQREAPGAGSARRAARGTRAAQEGVAGSAGEPGPAGVPGTRTGHRCGRGREDAGFGFGFGFAGGPAAAGQGPVDEAVGTEHAAAAAQGGRQHQVGEPHQARVVLDEGGLGLLDAHRRGRSADCGFPERHVRQNERIVGWSPGCGGGVPGGARDVRRRPGGMEGAAGAPGAERAGLSPRVKTATLRAGTVKVPAPGRTRRSAAPGRRRAPAPGAGLASPRARSPSASPLRGGVEDTSPTQAGRARMVSTPGVSSGPDSGNDSAAAPASAVASPNTGVVRIRSSSR